MATEADEFTALLRQIIIEEKLCSATQIASALGFAPRTLYARLHNRSRFSPDEVAGLLEEVQDSRLATWLLAKSSMILIQHPPKSADDLSAQVAQKMASCAEASADALQALVARMEFALPKPSQQIGFQIRRAQSELLIAKLWLAGEEREVRARPHIGFPALVRQRLLTERGIRMSAMAASLGMSYGALYTRMAGRVPFEPIDIRNLLAAYPDPVLADYLLAGTRYRAFPAPEWGHLTQALSPMRAGLQAIREIVGLLAALREAESMTDLAKTTAGRCFDQALALLEMMHWSVTYIGRPRPANFSEAPNVLCQPLRQSNAATAGGG